MKKHHKLILILSLIGLIGYERYNRELSHKDKSTPAISESITMQLTNENIMHNQILRKFPDDASAARGQELHLKILSRYPFLEAYYKRPYIWGSATGSPQCCISVPKRYWDSELNEDQKALLGRYAASYIQIAKDNPSEYLAIDSNAPSYNRLIRNISAMNQSSWCIMIGNIINNGADIAADETSMYGTQYVK